MASSVNKIVAQTFLDMANAIETGTFGKKPIIAITGIGSEHGEEAVMLGALLAQKDGADVVYIGTLKNDLVRCVYAKDEHDVHKEMEQLLESGEIDGAVTMHYPFPIGVSTVGRAITPSKGLPMYIANTTGTSSTDRVEGMVKNAIYGIIAAKACGNEAPTVGIANVDGARQCEIALKKLSDNGYPINFAVSTRADGGCVMRGNDILTGSADIMVTDSLTGNLIIKMLSAFNSGGSYETTGWGYGPGIGNGQKNLIMIISRASGSQVIAGAIAYAVQLVKGNWKEVMKEELEKAEQAGLSTIIAKKAVAGETKEISAPAKEIVTAIIAGIEIMSLEDAVSALWVKGIYAESGMGCTGPVIMVSEGKLNQATELLAKSGFIGE